MSKARREIHLILSPDSVLSPELYQGLFPSCEVLLLKGSTDLTSALDWGIIKEYNYGCPHSEAPMLDGRTRAWNWKRGIRQAILGKAVDDTRHALTPRNTWAVR